MKTSIRQRIGFKTFALMERAIIMKEIFRLLQKVDNKKKASIEVLLRVGTNPLPALSFFNMRTLQKFLETQSTYTLRNTWEHLRSV